MLCAVVHCLYQLHQNNKHNEIQIAYINTKIMHTKMSMPVIG